jgi:S-adenosylmethionine/arginine decarboxylase-like enzyme
MNWGYHLLLNLARCNKHKITDRRNIELFTDTLVKKIDMVPYGRPQIVHFGSEDKAGYTLVQLIETSNITGHFCNSSGDAYLDIFSCKPFEKQVAEQTAKEFFQPEVSDSLFLTRTAGKKME